MKISNFKKYFFANLAVFLSFVILVSFGLYMHSYDFKLTVPDKFTTMVWFTLLILIYSYIGLLISYALFLVEMLFRKIFPNLKVNIKFNIEFPEIITKIYNIIFTFGFISASALVVLFCILVVVGRFIALII